MNLLPTTLVGSYPQPDWLGFGGIAFPGIPIGAHAAETGAVLFSFSDRPVQKTFGLWREEVPLIEN